MALVLIRLLNDDPSTTPIEGVSVEVYSTAAIFQTSGTTDAAGEVQFVLPDAEYDLMFFKTGVSVVQPQRIVVDSLLSNEFEVSAHVRTLPESSNPLRCTISGYIMGVGGGPAQQRLIFAPEKDLTILTGLLVAPYSRLEVVSDEEGYFEFELLRDTKYTAYFLHPQELFGQQPGKLAVQTPDLPAAELDDLLFPLPVNFNLSQNTISISVSAIPDETVTYDLSFSDGSIRNTRSALSLPWAGVTLTNTDNTIVEAYFLEGGVLGLRGLSPGTVTISTTRSIPTKVLFDPLPGYATESIVVTVA